MNSRGPQRHGAFTGRLNAPILISAWRVKCRKLQGRSLTSIRASRVSPAGGEGLDIADMHGAAGINDLDVITLSPVDQGDLPSVAQESPKAGGRV